MMFVNDQCGFLDGRLSSSLRGGAGEVRFAGAVLSHPNERPTTMLTQLGRSHWQAYFDRVSGALRGACVQIDVTGLGPGVKVEAESIPLIGISYDPKDDMLIVAGEGLKHMIHHPTQIHVDHDMEWLYRVEAIDAERQHHIVLLTEPLRLPAAPPVAGAAL